IRGKRGAQCSAIVELFDDVFLDRLDDYAFVLQPLDRLVDLGALAVDLQRNEAHLRGDRRPADVEEDVEFLRQLADERLLHELLRKREIDPLGHFFFLRLHRRHQIENCRLPTAMRSRQPTHRFVVRYLSPKSGKTVTSTPERSLRAICSAAYIAAPEDWPTRMPSSWLKR